jgi:hypothetical protein
LGTHTSELRWDEREGVLLEFGERNLSGYAGRAAATNRELYDLLVNADKAPDGWTVDRQ